MPKISEYKPLDIPFPARSGSGPEAEREYRIALANMQAERMLMSDNPPVQVVMHHLKMDSARERADLELIKARTALAQSEIARIEADAKAAADYAKILECLTRYGGGELDASDIF
jgi:hypothetical protein